MARLARVVVAGVPHHVTQRGNELCMVSPDLPVPRSARSARPQICPQICRNPYAMGAGALVGGVGGYGTEVVDDLGLGVAGLLSASVESAGYVAGELPWPRYSSNGILNLSSTSSTNPRK